MQLQIIGLCRFSLLSHGGFQDMPEDIEDRRMKLFDPQRLSLRLRWFEQVTLPTIRAQRDTDFTFLVVTSEELPEPFASQLAALCAEIPHVKLMKLPIGDHREQCAVAMLEHIDAEAHKVAQFRLDDDDGVALDFIAQIRWRSIRLTRAFRPNESFGLDFQRGMVIAPQSDGLHMRMVHAQHWTPGLVYVLPSDSKQTLMDYFHHRAWRHMNMIGFPNLAMFIRGDHGTNDSGKLTLHFELPFKPAILQKQLHERFGLDPDELQTRLLG